jgi:hypothetical protein
MPWDREDKRHRLNDGRAYDVGLSDDAGAANNLGFATSQAYSPGQDEVNRLDDYIAYTLYGSKPDKPHTMGLQYQQPNNGVRLTVYYYCESPPCDEAPHFPYNYTEQKQCGSEGGLNYNWCMDEKISNASYRGFNYPHQIASYYAMYRVARNHQNMKTKQSWQWYLERAANTTIRLGYAGIGYMDGTVTREVLRSILEENSTQQGMGVATV